MLKKEKNDIIVSIVIHLPEEPPYAKDKLEKMLATVMNQYEHKTEIILLNHKNDSNIENSIQAINKDKHMIVVINGKQKTHGAWLNRAIESSKGQYILYMDNRTSEIYLKNSAVSAFYLSSLRYPDSGLIYSDYELESDGKIQEIRLLKHHTGRVRDNQDLGKVLFFKKSIIRFCNGFDESLLHHTLYDIRLKIAGKSTLIHIANKCKGALYSIRSESKKHNVFDYLQDNKSAQLEAEKILTEHLKRINAYLEPGKYYHLRQKHISKEKYRASVIIPVNNRPEFIGTAIESVLEQTIHDIEIIIVVNGGEEDPTIKTVKEYMPGGKKYKQEKPPVQLIVLDINNIGFCLNEGVNKARGEYYIQLDSDDRLKPFAIERILHEFDSDPSIGMVIGSYEVWQLNEQSGALERMSDIPVVTHDEWTDNNGRNNLLRINGAGAPRAIPINIIKETGYFGMNEEAYSQNYGEDYDMVLKISEKYRIGRIWEPIYEVVRHKGGTDHSIDQETITCNDEAKDYMRLKAIKRRQELNH